MARSAELARQQMKGMKLKTQVTVEAVAEEEKDGEDGEEGEEGEEGGDEAVHV